MTYRFDYNLEKDSLLKKTRNVSFADVVEAVNKSNKLADVKHFNQDLHPNQSILIVKIKNYAYAVPYVTDKKKKTKFLKTIYANRKLTNLYLRNKKKNI